MGAKQAHHGRLQRCVSRAALTHTRCRVDGPGGDSRPVSDVAERFTASWGGSAEWRVETVDPVKPEARTLSVDSARARAALGWLPRWAVDEAVHRTAVWYRDFAAGVAPAGLVTKDLDAFLAAPDVSG